MNSCYMYVAVINFVTCLINCASILLYIKDEKGSVKTKPKKYRTKVMIFKKTGDLLYSILLISSIFDFKFSISSVIYLLDLQLTSYYEDDVCHLLFLLSY